MWSKIFVIGVLLVAVNCKSVIVGNTGNNGSVKKVFEKTFEASAIPLFKRVKDVDFEYAINDQVIKGISITDLLDSEAEPSITRGGIGFNYAHIKLRSVRGSGYKFLVELYA
ncbi:unnamed protein product [Leptidea sinapis]|uniref:Uncharacterized protein n=1 Tax=Leptidea sinapis TaxID=189913 RepID=A0A5E4PPN8_9NEOP|nr:unnamed protein product [Leptidea sinapis]